MKGVIAPGVVPTVLRSIYLGRRTGMLRFIRDDERRSVRFMSGHIVYGEASVPSLRLGEVLVAAGRLDPVVLAEAASVVQRERKRMGAVLMEMRVLDENGLEEALALHVRAILASVLSLREGTYTFQEQDPEAFLDDDWPLAISTAEAVLAAVRAVRSREDVRYALGDLDRVLLASDDPLVLYQRMDRAPEEEALLSRVDGTRTAGELVRASGLGEATAERSLLGLLCTGILEFALEAARASAPPVSLERLREEILELHQGLARRTDHEILGVAPGASPADLKAAFFRMARRYHPDVVHERGMGDLREKLEAVFFRVNDAYRTLHAARTAAPVAGPPADPAAPASFDFEDMLRVGRERLDEGKTWEAVSQFEEVARAATGRRRNRARVLLGRALLQMADREKAAEKALQEAVKDDPAHVEAHYLLGTLYRRRGLAARATAMFKRALEIDPAHRAALAEMDAMASDAPPVPRARSPRRT